MFLIVTSFRENEFSNVSIHSKYIFSREKVGDCSQFNFTFLTDKYVPTEIRDIYIYFKDIYCQEIKYCGCYWLDKTR